MIMMTWKPNWNETKQRFNEWWAHQGLVITGGSFPAAQPHEGVEEPGEPPFYYPHLSVHTRRSFLLEDGDVDLVDLLNERAHPAVVGD